MAKGLLSICHQTSALPDVRPQVVPLGGHEDHDDGQDEEADPGSGHGQLQDEVVPVGKVPQVAEVGHRLELLVGGVILPVQEVRLVFRLEDLGVLNIS